MLGEMREERGFILVRLPQTNRLMVFFAEQRGIFKECDVVAEGTEEEMHRFRELGSELTPEWLTYQNRRK